MQRRSRSRWYEGNTQAARARRLMSGTPKYLRHGLVGFSFDPVLRKRREQFEQRRHRERVCARCGAYFLADEPQLALGCGDGGRYEHSERLDVDERAFYGGVWQYAPPAVRAAADELTRDGRLTLVRRRGRAPDAPVEVQGASPLLEVVSEHEWPPICRDRVTGVALHADRLAPPPGAASGDALLEAQLREAHTSTRYLEWDDEQLQEALSIRMRTADTVYFLRRARPIPDV